LFIPRESHKRFPGIQVGVVVMKKLLVIVAGLLGAVLAGGAGWQA
jgi:hypothetical protein